MNEDIINRVVQCGYDVYMRHPNNTYMIFTDGTNLGYLEDGRYGINISTVHKPNRTHGTGFRMHTNLDAEEIGPRVLQDAFIHTPDWASFKRDVVKWPNIEAFIRGDGWNSGYSLVRKGEPRT